MSTKNDTINPPTSLSFSLKEFEEFVQDAKKVQDLGFALPSLKKLLQQEKSKKNQLKQTITLDLEKKFVYISTVESRSFDKPEKVRTSGHYFDNKLKGKTSQGQMTLFDALSPATKERKEKTDVQVSAEGIRLTPPQNRLITALTNLLHDKSEHSDTDSTEFYSGNHTPVPFNNYGGVGDPSHAPAIQIKPAELYKAYLNSDNYSGADIKFIRKLVTELSEKKFLIRYDRKREVYKNGKLERRTDRIELDHPLIKVINFIPDLSDEEIESLDAGQREIAERKGVYIIALNPLLTDQIRTKYVEFPKDIEKRTILASGGSTKVTEAAIAFRDYMLRELSAKRFKCEIDEENLLYTLRLENYLKRRQVSLAKQRLEDAILVSKKLGLVFSANRTIGKKGQVKLEFELNPHFD